LNVERLRLLLLVGDDVDLVILIANAMPLPANLVVNLLSLLLTVVLEVATAVQLVQLVADVVELVDDVLVGALAARGRPVLVDDAVLADLYVEVGGARERIRGARAAAGVRVAALGYE
jgi:hypothetical protein